MRPLLRSALFLSLLCATGVSGVRASERAAPSVAAAEEAMGAAPSVAAAEKATGAAPIASSIPVSFKPVMTLRLGATALPFPGDVLPLAAASVSITRLRPFDLELGVGSPIFALHAYLRAGWVFWDVDRRNVRGRGWKWEALGQGGIQAILLPYSQGVFGVLGVTAHAALDGTYWIAPHFGLTLRTTLGATVDFRSWPPLPEAGLSLGLAF